MRKIILILFVIFGISFLLLTQSCHTSQRGIVPCPSYGKTHDTKTRTCSTDIYLVAVRN